MDACGGAVSIIVCLAYFLFTLATRPVLTELWFWFNFLSTLVLKIWTQCQITLIFCGPSLQFVVIKSAREHWKVPVNIRKLISKFIKICPWTSKSAREHLRYLCPWTPQKCPWKRPKKCPWTHSVAREHSQKVPVNAKKCPWNLLKKWRSRALLMFTGEKKNTELNIRYRGPIIPFLEVVLFWYFWI